MPEARARQTLNATRLWPSAKMDGQHLGHRTIKVATAPPPTALHDSPVVELRQEGPTVYLEDDGQLFDLEQTEDGIEITIHWALFHPYREDFVVYKLIGGIVSIQLI